MIAGEPVELPNDRAVSRSMDNRLGCFVAYEAGAPGRRGGRRPGDVVAVAAVQEETTFGGSATTAYALRPDVAIVVDVTHATDAPGIDVNELGKHPLGSGPVIERGSSLNPHVFELLYETAEAEGIPYTIAAQRAQHRDRRRRDAPQPRRRPGRARQHAPALSTVPTTWRPAPPRNRTCCSSGRWRTAARWRSPGS